jgi:hypothetical protein
MELKRIVEAFTLDLIVTNDKHATYIKFCRSGFQPR